MTNTEKHNSSTLNMLALILGLHNAYLNSCDHKSLRVAFSLQTVKLSARVYSVCYKKRDSKRTLFRGVLPALMVFTHSHLQRRHINSIYCNSHTYTHTGTLVHAPTGHCLNLIRQHKDSHRL